MTKFLLPSLLFLCLSCVHQGIRWNPDFYVGDATNAGIISENGDFISASDPRFNSYACLSEQKVKELVELLQRARIDKDKKKSIIKQINESYVAEKWNSRY